MKLFLALSAILLALCFGPAANAVNAPVTCAIQTYNGHYLTAVNAGGQATNALRTNATNVQAWEKFTFVDAGNGYYGIQTLNGNFLTATGGGGHDFDTDPNPIHSDATTIRT